MNNAYVLMTAAHNEEANIEKTIQCVLAQTLLPKRWSIVSDNSRDRTDEIVQKYASHYEFIRFLRVTRPPGRGFASKVMALQKGQKLVDDVPFSFIGNLDADVTLDPTYFEELIARFEKNPDLGLAGGFVYEEQDGSFQSREMNSIHSVAHAAQLVRHECFEAIRGYAVLEFGGEDWHAQTSARMKGWHVEAFPDLKIYHQRRTGTAGSPLKHGFRQGRMDYSLGSDPVFEIIKCVRRMLNEPFVLGGLVRLAGFVWSSVHRDKRTVSSEFVTFLRKEQRQRFTPVLHNASLRKRTHA
jgi:poly-beta-1,6-N-acetyl-D-glucosamine synthase